jgi:hypothetical protein
MAIGYNSRVIGNIFKVRESAVQRRILNFKSDGIPETRHSLQEYLCLGSNGHLGSALVS